jgi:hypothetical protein
MILNGRRFEERSEIEQEMLSAHADADADADEILRWLSGFLAAVQENLYYPR